MESRSIYHDVRRVMIGDAIFNADMLCIQVKPLKVVSPGVLAWRRMELMLSVPWRACPF